MSNLAMFWWALIAVVAIIVGPMMALRVSKHLRERKIDPAKLNPRPYADKDEEE